MKSKQLLFILLVFSFTKAQALAEKIRVEDGVRVAVDLIEKALA